VSLTFSLFWVRSSRSRGCGGFSAPVGWCRLCYVRYFRRLWSLSCVGARRSIDVSFSSLVLLDLFLFIFLSVGLALYYMVFKSVDGR
jgi:hypothetical protein